MLQQPLNNPKHEAFAQHLAAGMGVHEAYREAGYKGNATAATRLKNDPAVAIRVASLQTDTAKRAEITREDIVKQLMEDRTFAKERGAPAAMISATMGIAKLLGHLVDKQEISGAGANPITGIKIEFVDPPKRAPAKKAKASEKTT